MADWQDSVQNILLGAKYNIWKIDAALAAWGWPLSGASSSSGDWSGTGGNLVPGAWRSRRNPSSAPFRFDVRYQLGNGSTKPHAILMRGAPWVGTAGGWNEGGATFDLPYTTDKEFFVHGGVLPTNLNIVANDRAVIVWSYWTPPAAQAGNYTYTAPDTITADFDWHTIGAAIGAYITPNTGGGTNNGKTFRITAMPTLTTLTVEPSDAASSAGVANNAVAAGTVTIANTHYLAYFGRMLPHEVLASFKDDRPFVGMCGTREMPYGDYPSAYSFLRSARRIYAKTSSGYIPLVAGKGVIPKDADLITGPVDDDDEAYSTASSNPWIESCRVRWHETVSATNYVDHGGRLEGLLVTSREHVRKRIGQHATDSQKSTHMSHGGIIHVWPNGAAAAAT